MNTKQQIIDALRTFIAQRPGFEPGNYSDWRSYRSEMAGVTRDRHHAEALLREVDLRDSITAKDILAQCGGGRLQIRLVSVNEAPPHTVHVNYCTGQYFPTEYRKAVARLMAGVLWTWTREHAMPATDTETGHVLISGNWQTPGDWLRAHFRKQFGRGLADRYFN